ncbi:MarR family transcriptional regulator [Undibacterium sp. Jales W-56]|uniref:MarR family winged helix-turn-helix transcriptional regulator n=1 Tax=Undibacterium sp. Jales W-56 TaxID=2897325 RepID=UPI0021CFD799|nr:MarR family transcriptional regulator [Undibacterium sp. Jales W-56]MCU6433404.1 MarR family transcriptional regulator [Undibacterium sp. Jales W-56]
MEQQSKAFSFSSYQVEESVGYLLSRTKTMLSKAVDDSLVDLGITHAQASVIMMLAIGRCSTAAELARDLFIDAGAMKRMLDRLVVKGFLARTPDVTDKRLFKLILTEQGRTLAESLPPIYHRNLDIAFTGFSPEEIGFLRSLLKKLLANRSLFEQTASPE